MKAISLWQPWASLWLTKRKIHETRHWLTEHRGPLLVHAAKTPTAMHLGYHNAWMQRILESEYETNVIYPGMLPIGAVIGVVEILDCLPAERIYDSAKSIEALPDDYWCGNFGAGRYAWQRGQFHVFHKPIPITGRQGFFNVPDDLVQPQLPAWAVA